MKALITGASSGIGKDMAYLLAERGYDMILVARRKEKLEKIKQELNTKVKIIVLDLAKIENCYQLYEQVKDEPIDILINNAGFGVFGKFVETDLEKELQMIDLNVKTVHVLTKLFLPDMKKRDHGYILNVASSAAFQPGPLMASYYASKAYVLRLTQAIYEELRKDHSQVVVSALCPGPVDTEFNKVADVKFSLKGLTSVEVARYAITQLFRKKLVIVPGIMMKLNVLFNRFVPTKLLLRIAYYIQKKKDDISDFS